MQHSISDSGLIAVRLERGDEVHTSILEIASKYKINAGFLLSGIGMLENPCLGYYIRPGEYAKKEFSGQFECLALTGNICLYDGDYLAHLHAICADEEYRAFGGHLVSSLTGITLEIGIQTIGKDVNMLRTLEAATGLPGLMIE